MNKLHFLWALPALLLASVLVGLLGSHTVNYQCKYITSVTTQVKDTGKYDTALYVIHYSDGTVGSTSDMDSYGPNGAERGTACKSVLEWGFPYSATNRPVVNQTSILKETK